MSRHSAGALAAGRPARAVVEWYWARRRGMKPRRALPTAPAPAPAAIAGVTR